MEFKAWPKIPRLENEVYTITEKIDGTNACVIITEDGQIGAQSRSRLISPGDDNFGFAAWVQDNKQELLKLGPGHHYGEWWGAGIQRGYGLDHKRFSLFAWWTPNETLPTCCYRIPLITTSAPERELSRYIEHLQESGSYAEPGYMRAEGLVVTSHHCRARYKIILDK
jgi:hypothetical protein